MASDHENGARERLQISVRKRVCRWVGRLSAAMNDVEDTKAGH